jgi:hypothetical protein
MTCNAGSQARRSPTETLSPACLLRDPSAATGTTRELPTNGTSAAVRCSGADLGGIHPAAAIRSGFVPEGGTAVPQILSLGRSCPRSRAPRLGTSPIACLMTLRAPLRRGTFVAAVSGQLVGSACGRMVRMAFDGTVLQMVERRPSSTGLVGDQDRPTPVPVGGVLPLFTRWSATVPVWVGDAVARCGLRVGHGVLTGLPAH